MFREFRVDDLGFRVRSLSAEAKLPVQGRAVQTLTLNPKP